MSLSPMSHVEFKTQPNPEGLNMVAFEYGRIDQLSLCSRLRHHRSLALLCPVLSLKPGSHRRIVKDYRSKTGKDQEILIESVRNLLQIFLKLQFSNNF